MNHSLNGQSAVCLSHLVFTPTVTTTTTDTPSDFPGLFLVLSTVVVLVLGRRKRGD